MFRKLSSKTISESELAEGQMKGIHLKGKAVLLARVDGQVYAVSDICPHAGCHLHTGILNGSVVMCPCHGWKFDIHTGEFEANSLIKLERFDCKTENGKIQVNL
jgi:3-phenylpropionate/trans-cinnamate dioxygenase ferredoxin subunit